RAGRGSEGPRRSRFRDLRGGDCVRDAPKPLDEGGPGSDGARPQADMNKQKWIAFAVTLMLIAGIAGFLRYLKANQKLGTPGVKVVPAHTANGFEVPLPEHVLDYTSELREASKEEIAALPKDTTFGRRRYLANDGLGVKETHVTV